MDSFAGITILSKLSRKDNLLSTRERTVLLCSPIPPVNTIASNFFFSDGNICAMPSETLVQNMSNASSADSSPLAAASSACVVDVNSNETSGNNGIRTDLPHIMAYLRHTQKSTLAMQHTIDIAHTHIHGVVKIEHNTRIDITTPCSHH